jgi:hypothetical protein
MEFNKSRINFKQINLNSFKFKFDNTIVNTLNMKFNEFLVKLKSFITIYLIHPN